MGIPLEEMDAVFGEGIIYPIWMSRLVLSTILSLLEAVLTDDEDEDGSETASLVRHDSISRPSYTAPEQTNGPRSPDRAKGNWLSGFTRTGRSQTAYKPVRDGGDGESE